MVTRQSYVDDAEMDVIKQLQDMHTTLLELKEDPIPAAVTLEFLDPQGHSQILHADAIGRELQPEEYEELPVGPEAAVFSNEDIVE
jgi:C4-type Zn-finger protein